MDQKELTTYAKSLVGVPYNKSNNPANHSIKDGFKCYTFITYLLSLTGIMVGDLPTQFNFLRRFRNEFEEVDGFNYLDIPVFHLSEMETRHVGLMLNDYEFIHCSTATNGVAVNEIDKLPWNCLLRKVYRHK